MPRMLQLATCVCDDETGETLTIRPRNFAAFSQSVNGGAWCGVLGMLHMDQLRSFFCGGWPSGGRWRTETYGMDGQEGGGVG